MNDIITAIDKEIAQLKKVRAFLSATADSIPAAKKRGRGRPAGSKNKTKLPTSPLVKRIMSVEGKAKTAAAQKKRWAAAKKAA